jgi:hypothetical protein
MTEQEVLRIQKWRSGIIRHVQDVTYHVDKTCRYYGIY